MILAEILKQPSKFDCLKHPSVLQLEELQYTPFHLVALLIFACAVIHTLFVYKIHNWARSFEKTHPSKTRNFFVQMLYFLAEVEVVFAFWVIPLFFAIAFFYDRGVALEYLNTRNYTEPLFVVVVLSLSATRPIIHIAEKTIGWCAKRLNNSMSAWWFSLLTFGPLLGSLITEAGAMTLCALLLSRQFYIHRPSPALSYASLALLFVNISVGGVLTDFASPAVLVLAHCWHWTMADMFVDFGWKAALGILIANGVYWFYFRKELSELDVKKKGLDTRLAHMSRDEKSIPLWIIFVHILFIIWIVTVSHYPAVFIASYLFFIGFHQATREHQYPIRIARPMLVGLFLAGLVIHGELQGWWVVNLMDGLSPIAVMGVAMGLTAFNDNTAISYLAGLVPNWGNLYEYAVFTGIIAGGGLTVIANAPNPAGYAILKHHFEGGISPIKLLTWAFVPTVILYAVFYLLGPLFLS
jgi:hypothetical protein